jgi:hypothetical protein
MNVYRKEENVMKHKKEHMEEDNFEKGNRTRRYL